MQASTRTHDRERRGVPYTEETLREGGLYRLQEVLGELLAQYGIEAPGIDTPPPVLYRGADRTVSPISAAVAC